MMHFLVQQAQEPFAFASISCATQHVPQPVFLVLYGPSAREEELNQFHSLSATTAR